MGNSYTCIRKCFHAGRYYTPGMKYVPASAKEKVPRHFEADDKDEISQAILEKRKKASTPPDPPTMEQINKGGRKKVTHTEDLTAAQGDTGDEDKLAQAAIEEMNKASKASATEGSDSTEEE